MWGTTTPVSHSQRINFEIPGGLSLLAATTCLHKEVGAVVRKVSHPQPVGAVAALVLVCLVSACGSAPADSALATAPAVGAVGVTQAMPENGYPLPDCRGKDPSVCVHDGFDPTVHGFSFPNWGGSSGELGTSGLVALFGKDLVCARITPEGCVVYPGAQEWAKQVNEAMAGGHCLGMAVLAERLFLGGLPPKGLDPAIVRALSTGGAKVTDLKPGAQAASNLSFDDPGVRAAVDLWWATQATDRFQQIAHEQSTWLPSKVVATIRDGLVRHQGSTLAFWWEVNGQGVGHAVTPLGVSQEGDQIAVSIYDNNFPGTVQRIMVDPVAERWSYAMGSTNPNEPTNRAEGGVGSLAVVPQFALPVKEKWWMTTDSSVGAAPTTNFFVTTPDPEARVGLSLTVDGVVYDASDADVVLPDGVAVRSNVGLKFGNGMVVEVDQTKATSVSLSPKAKGAGGKNLPITLSSYRDGRPRVTLRGEADASGSGSASMTVDKTGKVSAVAGTGSQAVVNVAGVTRSLDFRLPAEAGLTLGPAGGSDDSGAYEVTLMDSDGELLGTFDFESETESGDLVAGQVSFDMETGEFTVDEEEVDPELLDEDLLRSLVSMEPDTTGAQSGSAPDAQSGSQAGSDSASGGDAGSGGDSGSDSAVDEPESNLDAESDPDADVGSDSESDPGAD